MKRAASRFLDILHDPRIPISSRRLASEKRSQHEAFRSLRTRFSELYESSKRDVSLYTTPLWEETNTSLESTLLPAPPFDFLRDPILRWMMFLDSPRSDLFRCEISHLEERFHDSELVRFLREDPVGRPRISHSKYSTSHNLIHHLFHLSRFMTSAQFRPDEADCIIEWGAGYGSLARLTARIRGRIGTYIIVDTPLISCLQWIYLSTIFGTDQVRFHLPDTESEVQPGLFNLIPLSSVDRMRIKGDVFISTWALSESSIEAQDFVVDQDWFDADHLLLAYDADSKVVPYSGRVGDIAMKAGARIEETRCLPGHFYAFR